MAPMKEGPTLKASWGDHFDPSSPITQAGGVSKVVKFLRAISGTPKTMAEKSK